MRLKWFIPLCFLLFLGTPIFAQEEQEIIERITHAASQARILAISIYYEENAHSRNRTPEKLDFLLNESYRIAHKNNDKDFKEYLDFYSRIRAVMFVPESDLRESEMKMLEIWRQALKHYQSVGDERFIAICHAHIGLIHFTLNQYSESIARLLTAGEWFQKAGYNRCPMVSRYLHDMALIFYFFRAYQKVVDLMTVAVQLPPHDENKHIQRYNTLGAAYKQLKQYHKAEEAFLKTIETAQAYHNDIWKAIGTGYLATLFMDQGKYAEALDLYKNTLPYAGDEHNVNNKEYADHLLGMAKACILLNDLPQAREYLSRIKFKGAPNTKERYVFGKAHHEINYWLNYYDVKHRYYQALKNFRQAYFYNDSLYLFKYMIDSTFNRLEVKVAQNRVVAQKKQFENDNRAVVLKNRNQLLFFLVLLAIVVAVSAWLLFLQNRKVLSQNTLINQQMDALQKILMQKQVLMKELQHRIKNNLQHVISILDIQKDSVDFNNIEELIRENQNRIHSMALLHSRLNSVADMNVINLREYLTGLSTLVKDSYGNQGKDIALSLRCETEHIDIEKALPIGLIIVELISNSIKHAFENRDEGSIAIAVWYQEETQKNVLYYRDNGRGFDFNLKKTSGLGLEIIKGLIDQLYGAIETYGESRFELKVYF